VLATTAQSGEGVDELLETVEKHRAWLVESGQLERAPARPGAEIRVQDVVNRELKRIAWRSATRRRSCSTAGVERIRTSDATPYSVAKQIIDGLLR
jgi:LAO/AO transport system kinase